MKRLDRYLIKEMSVPVIVGVVVTALLFIGNEMIAVFRILNLSQVPPLAIVKYMVVKMPTFLTFTIPTGIALGSSLALSRLVRDGELTAMRSAGYSIKRILVTVLVAGAAFSGVAFFNAEKLVPRASVEERKLASELLIIGNLPQFERNLMIKLPPYVANFGEVEQYQNGSLRLADILLIERPRPGQEMVFRAKKGHYYKGIWTIEDPKVWLFEGGSLSTVDKAATIVINQRIELRDFLQGTQPENAPASELWERITAGRKAGANTRVLEVNFYERFALPAACIVFALSSALLSVKFPRGSAFQGLLLSFLTLWAFLNIHSVATTVLGQKGWLPPIASAWVTVGAFGLLTLMLLRSLE